MNATVVVSCFKQEHYISECLESILSQKVDFLYNILVADDASTDKTPQILLDYSTRYSDKIKLILREKNVGAAKNYLDAHANASGDIVFHIDGDDVMLPGKLQRQYDVFKRYSDVNIVIHKALWFSDDGSHISSTGTPLGADEACLFFSLSDLALWGTIAVHSAYAYRRSSRSSFAIEREFMEWYFAMDSLLLGGKGCYLNEQLVKYRSNPFTGAYLSTIKGRRKSYAIYLNDVEYYFSRLPKLRPQLYSNYMITTLAAIRSGAGVAARVVMFLLFNLIHFRISLLRQTVLMRRSVSKSIVHPREPQSRSC